MKLYPLYRLLRSIVRLVYPKMTLEGTDFLPEGPVLIVANHAQIHGPLATELYLPGNRYTWCAGEMTRIKEVPAYAYRDFWSHKPRWTRPFYKLLSYLIAPLSVFLFSHARIIPVFRDTRGLITFKTTLRHLENGAQIVIFPETDGPDNGILSEFQTKYVDLARMYYRRCGKPLSFVPLYIAPELCRMCFGPPVTYRPDSPMEEERTRITAHLKREITQTARALPCHTVIPYRNIKKKEYPKNRPEDSV